MMKKATKFILYMSVAILAATGVHKGTKRRQVEAKEKGRHVPYGPYEAVIKRPLDIFLSGLALIILSPILLLTTLVIKYKLGNPVIFSQERPGLNGKIFRIYKFRSMTNAKDSNGKLLPDEERLTGFGKILRSTSLDELPELINIVKGDMAIVGPRPLLVEYLPRYNERQARRHEVRPGLTGYAQISGRNSLSWDEKFEGDVEYVEKITFWRDLKIMLETVKVVLGRSGISSDTSVTMGVFMGNESE